MMQQMNHEIMKSGMGLTMLQTEKKFNQSFIYFEGSLCSVFIFARFESFFFIGFFFLIQQKEFQEHHPLIKLVKSPKY